MKKVVAEEDLPRNQFSTDALISCTRKYAHILKDLGKETFYHALIKRDPKLSDETITLIVDNEVQVAYITPILPEFVVLALRMLRLLVESCALRSAAR